jgi:mannose-6-phosphate isomerase-like protein (cupin superfamily)
MLPRQSVGEVLGIAGPIDIGTADRYVWGDVCHGWHLLKHADLSVIQESVPPGAGEIEHYHARARQFFYVLAGLATMKLGETTFALRAGQGLHVPPGVRHRFGNTSDTEVVFIVISSPTTADDRINVTPPI